ncbi:ADL058Wp [Eremothecium gossypii ATCC 10895]|uniref:Mitochondrial fission 1 protein n=1 Tax=Eremothecium gossypii (strain ATCC 10895 / CBS 109.51 / FGSC 9923 / NRRL Y-1056) TaxID=284811 RepID=FIS1_EREGS|nr:ADL058Wp [Eremothecium gossypii ATCC 10895]Q75AI5.1 RecName: Full=Mitochondrial fission 1 protein [Eremothecium gossypii ATCC 10895]AAS51862.1 ADL058Wp [Eremothecium gossypii ATCC 10895]AEY96159.1 FADL058Wp [Eremothecium gossypii FDAG1]
MSNINFLPTIEDAYGALSAEQLDILRQQVLSEGGDIASIQSRFNYAWGLVKSHDAEDQRLGVKLLTDIYKESPMRRRESLYYLAIGCYKLGEYAMAKRYADALVAHEPDNAQARTLKAMVEQKIQTEGLKGAALVGAGLAAVAAAAGFLLRQRRP